MDPIPHVHIMESVPEVPVPTLCADQPNQGENKMPICNDPQISTSMIIKQNHIRVQ